ncbi:NUDIX domain-containing protein [Campylobacter geochelonis]|uniref:Uridine diphosphate glucose pyrophosphatase n=1 Tax=Campylobacter geochelonis TaxID=1780362 RepID=A0A128EI64_9BACT|nr:NUDIX domain-containing protein [Campylobacter geochelonis]QKF71609.1 Nudix-type nucleoside diphosphatase, YffH/AdpP family [Campylobacter geochelonis]CZE48679.1 uridine diphosphate glucose pyrophosphatase [Campylobacter geochelonis]CZE48724.1 uridine diphosphate glucose pyrophosphatase [Campylobacter geochelonis]CZE51270.1 uridine diphosphate glucose pyrophosphatase [Campylobacter geochelonis]
MDTTIKNVKITKMPESNFIKPFRMEFERDGKAMHWDCVKVHDSVSVLLYHEEKEAFLLVKQFRPAVWCRQKEDVLERGFTYELCAGILDKGISEEETIIEEIYEEVGYKVENVVKIGSFYSSFGFAGGKQTIFYAKINESMKKWKGGGIDNEQIEPFYLLVKDAMKFVYDENYVKAASMAYCFMWFNERFKK